MTDIVSSFPIVEVQPLPPFRGVVTQWRASKGDTIKSGYTERSRRKRRFAWSPSEASDISGVPLRTVHQWKADDFVMPTFTWEKVGIVEPRYCSADVFALRFAADLRDAGLSTNVVDMAVSSHTMIHGHYEDHPCSFSSLLHTAGRWFVAADQESADFMQREFLETLTWGEADFYEDDDDGDHRHPFVRFPHLEFVEYPIAGRVAELSERCETWWKVARVPEDERPPWLK